MLDNAAVLGFSIWVILKGGAGGNSLSLEPFNPAAVGALSLVYGVLHGSFGVQGVEAVHFFSADLRRKRTLDQVEQRLRLMPEALFMSYEHRVVVQQ